MLYVNPVSNPASSRSIEGNNDSARRAMALQELEHLFLFTLLQEMRKSVPEDTLLGGGAQRKHFDEMFDDAVSGEMTKSGQFGLAKQIEQQIQASEARKLPKTGEGPPLAATDHGLPFKEGRRIAVNPR